MSRRTRMVHRSDANQSTIVGALKAVGATVEHLGGKGVPDLLIGYSGRNYLLEVKTKKGKLNDDQRTWHTKWSGQVAVVRTIADAFRVVGVPFRKGLEETA